MPYISLSSAVNRYIYEAAESHPEVPRTLEAYKALLKDQIDEYRSQEVQDPNISQNRIISEIRKTLPKYSATKGAERAQREQLHRRAVAAQNDMAIRESLLPPEFSGFRPLAPLYTSCNTDEERAECIQVISSKDPVQINAYLMKRCRNMDALLHDPQGLTLERLRTMSKEQILDTYEQNLPLFRMLMDFDSIKEVLASTGCEVSKEVADYIQRLRPYQTLLSPISSYVDIMANPYYPDLPEEALFAANTNQTNDIIDNIDEFANELNGGEALTSYTSLINVHKDFTDRRRVALIELHLLDLGFDTRNIDKIPVYTAEPSSKVDPHFSRHDSVLRLKGETLATQPIAYQLEDGRLHVFAPGPGDDIRPRVGGAELLINFNTKERLSELMNDFNGARLMFNRGSEEFRTMGTALKTANERFTAMSAPPKSEELEALRPLFEQMSAASQAYMTRKRTERGIEEGAPFVANGSNEAKRFAAAEKIAAYAHDKLAQMDLAAASLQVRAERRAAAETARQNIVNDRAKDPSLLREEPFNPQLSGEKMASPLTSANSDFVTLFQVNALNSLVSDTPMHIQQAMVGLQQLSEKQSLSPAEQEQARELMGKVVTFKTMNDLYDAETNKYLAREMAHTYGQAPQRFEKLITGTKNFQDFTKDLSPGKLCDFIGHERWKNMGARLKADAAAILSDQYGKTKMLKTWNEVPSPQAVDNQMVPKVREFNAFRKNFQQAHPNSGLNAQMSAFDYSALIDPCGNSNPVSLDGDAPNKVAELVTYNMVDLLYKSGNPEKAQQMEQSYLADPKKFVSDLQNDPSYQAIAGDLSGGRMMDLLTNQMTGVCKNVLSAQNPGINLNAPMRQSQIQMGGPQAGI